VNDADIPLITGSMERVLAVRDVVIARHNALNANDRATLEPMLHEHYFYVTDTGESYNKAQFLTNFFDQGVPHDSGDPDFTSIEVEGNIATVSCRVHGAFAVAGRAHHGTYNIFHTLFFEADEWKFIAGHFA
jgi:hypothetical protein